MMAVITWRPGIGDPNFLGWVNTIAYGVAALLCARAAIRAKRKMVKPGADSPKVWLGFAIGLMLLGLNKQLDLQTLLIQFGREAALSEGWYGQRRWWQGVFAAAIALIALTMLFIVLWKQRRFFRDHPSSLAGAILLLTYVLIRTASIDHADEAVGVNLDERPWLSALELVGIVCCVMDPLKRLVFAD